MQLAEDYCTSYCISKSFYANLAILSSFATSEGTNSHCTDHEQTEID